MIYLGLFDHDAVYAERLAEYISETYSQQAVVCLFSNREALFQYLHNNRLDLLLTSTQALKARQELPEKLQVAYLVEDRTIEKIGDDAVLFRYQRADALFRQMQGIAAAQADGNVVYGNRKSGRCIAFLGAAGGVGNTSVAIACAIRSAQKGQKVLYLNFEHNGCLDAYLESSGGESMTKVFYLIKTHLSDSNPSGDLATRLNGMLSQDVQTGVYYFKPFGLPIEAESVKPQEIELLLDSVAGAFDRIVLDMDSRYNQNLACVLEKVNRVVLVSNGETTANGKLKRILQAASVLEKSQDMRLGGKMMLLYNRFGSGAVQLQGQSVSVLGMIDRFVAPDEKQILRALSQKEFFDVLIEG